jgi:hypothetical protein
LKADDIVMKRNSSTIVIFALSLIIILIVVFGWYFKDKERARNPIKCYGNMQEIGAAIKLYLHDYGSFPGDKLDRSRSYPHWVKNLRDWYAVNNPNRDADQWVKDYFKCPSDKSSSITSYDINPQIFYQTPASLRDHEIIILAEKHFKGSHGRKYRIYIDPNDISGIHQQKRKR